LLLMWSGKTIQQADSEVGLTLKMCMPTSPQDVSDRAGGWVDDNYEITTNVGVGDCVLRVACVCVCVCGDGIVVCVV